MVTYICFVNWTWTDNEISHLSNITSINLKFKGVYATSKPPIPNFHFTIHNVPDNYTNIEAINRDKVFNTTSLVVFEDQISPVGNSVTYDKTITDVNFLNAINDAVKSGKNYLTLAIRSENGSSPWWTLSPIDGVGLNAIDLTLNFTTISQPYQFINRIENTEDTGEIVVKNTKKDSTKVYHSGIPVQLDPMCNYEVRTNILPFQLDWNAMGYTEKHNYWVINDNNLFSLKNSFKPDSSINKSKMIAQFNKTSNATIQTTSLEGISGMNIGFKDPWYYYTDYQGNWYQKDQFTTYSTPFHIQNNSEQSYGGVFLEQSGAPFWNPPYYSVNFPLVPANQIVNINGIIHPLYFINWTSSPSGSAIFQDPNSTTTGVSFKSDGAILTAVVKTGQVSNNSNAFINSSSRKVVRTDDGYLHMVYESMGMIWYEISRDNGLTWSLSNNARPLNSAGKAPSIDCFQNNIIITFQNNTDISLVSFYKNGTNYDKANELACGTIISNSIVANPAISLSFGTAYNPSVFMVVWQIPGALVYKYGTFDLNTKQIKWSQNSSQPVVITGTANSASNPAIACVKNNLETVPVFRLAWQEGSNAIHYTTFNYNTSNLSMIQSSVLTPSFNCYNNINTNPSVIAVPNGGARLCWKGGYEVDPDYTDYNVTFADPQNPYNFWYFNHYGQEIFSPVVSLGSKNYFIGWSEINSSTGKYDNICADSYTLRDMKVLINSHGRDLQINNGGGQDSTMIFAFQNQSSPFTFSASESIGKITSGKEAGSGYLKNGRIAILTKDKTQCFFALGNLNIDGQTIEFTEVKDTIQIKATETLNKFMETNSFLVADNSVIKFNMFYGVNDSAAASKLLSLNDYVSARVELIDASSGKVLGLYENITFGKDKIVRFKTTEYKIDSKGIAGNTVRLRLIISDNINPVYSLVRKNSGNNFLGKAGNLRELSVNGQEIVKDYSLNQNYPNPFNPSTVINYQIPKASKVSLKIYDVLGKEVRTLVNEFKSEGKYSLEFNANDLPSGIYIYELRANDYITSRKMMLVK